MSQLPDDVKEEGEVEPTKERSGLYFLNKMWICGFILFGAGNLTTWAALGLAPNSVLSCFNSWNIIFTFTIAPSWFPKCFDKPASSRSKYCAFILVIGCCWVAITGPRSYR